MASLKGPFSFTGSIENIRSYYDKKKKCYILATKGGSSKEIIETNPAFARTRENMNEFKACGIWVSKLCNSLFHIERLRVRVSRFKIAGERQLPVLSGHGAG